MYDDDLIAAAIVFEFGSIGMILATALFLVTVVSLVELATRADFEHDRDAARRRFFFVSGFAALLLILAVLNICGTVGLLPFTGVPIALLSRAGDLGLALIVTLVTASFRASEDRLKLPTRSRDIRTQALRVIMAPACAGLLAGLAATVAYATGWLGDPLSSWVVFHERPLAGTLARIERRVTEGVITFAVSAQSANEVAVNGQPIAEGEECELTEGDELRLGALRLRFAPDQFDPRLVLVGWELQPLRACRVGRVHYFDPTWWTQDQNPALNLSWDDFVDIDAGDFVPSSGAWSFVPPSAPYVPPQLEEADSGGERVYTTVDKAIAVPTTPAAATLRLGSSRCTFQALADGRLRADLVEPTISFPVSKIGGTYLGGGLMSKSPAFRVPQLTDSRTLVAARKVIESGDAELTDRGLVLKRVRGAAGNDVLAFNSYRYAARGSTGPGSAWRRNLRRFLAELTGSFTPSLTPASALIALPDGRPAGLDRELTRVQIAHLGGPKREPFRVLGRDGEELDAGRLGLVQLLGTMSGVVPGLNALAAALTDHPDERQRLSPLYPLIQRRVLETRPLLTTIHPEIQAAIVEALKRWALQWSSGARVAAAKEPNRQVLTAAVLVLDHRNQVLAVASYPMAPGISAVADALDRGAYDPQVEVLPFGVVSTGSVMKIVVWPFFLAEPGTFFVGIGGALYPVTFDRDREGHLIARPFVDRGVVSEALGKRIPPVHNAGNESYGLQDLAVHVARSINTSPVAHLGYLGSEGLDQLIDEATAQGMFAPFNLIPSVVEDPASKLERWVRWSGRNRALQPVAPDPFGNVQEPQRSLRPLGLIVRFHLGDLSTVSGLNVATALSTIANNGVLYPPQLVLALGDEPVDPQPPNQAMSPAVASLMARSLHLVPIHGTARRAFSGSSLLAPAFELIAKTGTPEHMRWVPDRNGKPTLVDDRSDKIFVANYRPLGASDPTRFTVLVYAKAAGPGGPGQPAIDADGPQRVAREIMENAAGLL